MEYEFEFDAAHKAFVCRVSGALDMDDIVRSIAERYERADYAAAAYFLLDMSEMPSAAFARFDPVAYRNHTKTVRARHRDARPSVVVEQMSAAADEEVCVSRTLADAFQFMESRTDSLD